MFWSIYNLTINSKKNFVSCDLWTTNKEFLTFLKEREEDLKRDLGINFNWWEANKSGGLRTTLKVVDVFDQSQFSTSFDWLYKQVKLFQKVFKKPGLAVKDTSEEKVGRSVN